MLTIDIETARRFILGKQGLWPGRRWRGLKGTEQAMRAMDYLQLDPLQIIARSQDIMLHSRVLDYKPDMWEDVTYKKRKFFDWGGWLAVRPMDELPHWRVVMRRERDDGSRLRAMAHDHADAIVEMRAILRERGTVSNRDFKMATDTFVILGLWLEDKALGKDEAFAEALARGFARFVTFLGASKMDTKAIREPLLRRRASSFIP
jgi:hypothetical protein